MKSMIKRTVMGTAIALAAMGANAADLYLSRMPVWINKHLGWK